MWNADKLIGKRICVAVSGGADSMTLLHYMKSLEQTGGYRLFAVHFEHGIRGEESVEDKRFVEKVCREWGVPLFVFEEDCIQRAEREKCSLETAARHFRYEGFERLIREDKTDLIATAHHKDDDAETVLFRLVRGTSLSGVKGIEAERGYILRPWLDRSKADILRYAQEHGIEFRQDRTNFETDATRNKLRLEVLPLLEKAVPGAGENLVRFSRLAEEDDKLLYELSSSLLTENERGATVAFCDQKPLFTRAALTAVKALGLVRDYTSTHLDGVFALQKSERGARLDLPQGVVAEKTGEGIALYKKEENGVLLPPVERVCVPFKEGVFDGDRYEVTVSSSPLRSGEALRIDGDALPEGACFRFREDGDRFEKFGGGTKSLKKFFNEKKLPVAERAWLPLVAVGHTVYVVCGVEIADAVKVTENTRRTLYIQTRKK